MGAADRQPNSKPHEARGPTRFPEPKSTKARDALWDCSQPCPSPHERSTKPFESGPAHAHPTLQRALGVQHEGERPEEPARALWLESLDAPPSALHPGTNGLGGEIEMFNSGNIESDHPPPLTVRHSSDVERQRQNLSAVE